MLRSARRALVLAVVLNTVIASLPVDVARHVPDVLRTFVPAEIAAAGEIVASPRYLSAAVLPNGQVGLLYANGDNGVNTAAEIRFVSYVSEKAINPSLQLSTAGGSYPQLSVFRGSLVAAYVDSRSGTNQGKLTFRVSTDSGATWGAESYPLGLDTFDWSPSYAPRVITSRDQQTLHVFKAVGGTVPQYRSTTDATLTTWSAWSNAGDATMAVASGSGCGAPGEAEVSRAHVFGFMETATTGQWIYIAPSPGGGVGNHGKGTQVGTLGGSWTAQLEQGGWCGISGSGADGGASTFLDRVGNVYFLRVSGPGDTLYWKRSTDGGLSWGSATYAYTSGQPLNTVGSPVGLYVPAYPSGEYAWYAGFGGVESAVRVIPLWPAANSYALSGTSRLFGSAGGDLPDFGEDYPYAYGLGCDQCVPAGIGTFVESAEDLALSGRRLSLSFRRWYTSADRTAGPLGPGWTHSYNWQLTDNTSAVELRRGDGSRSTFTRNPDGTYADPPNVYDVLTKNADSTYTLMMPSQVSYDFAATVVQDGDLARTKTPFACSPAYATYICDRAFDGADTSQFIADASGDGRVASVGSDLGIPKAVSKFHLNAGCGGTFRRFTISGSDDAITWTQRYDSLTDVAAGDLGIITLSGGPFTHRFWKLTGNGTTIGACGFIVFTLELIGGVVTPGSGRLDRIREPAGNLLTLGYSDQDLATLTDTLGRVTRLSYAKDLALGKPYTKSAPSNFASDDTGNKELTDGNQGQGDYNDSTWVGYTGLGAPLDVTVDLGAVLRGRFSEVGPVQRREWVRGVDWSLAHLRLEP